MSQAMLGIGTNSTGSSVQLAEAPYNAIWPTGSSMLSSICNLLPSVVVVEHRETVHLTFAQQRVMHRAVRRTFKMID
jgi:hypothetical protein